MFTITFLFIVAAGGYIPMWVGVTGILILLLLD